MLLEAINFFLLLSNQKFEIVWKLGKILVYWATWIDEWIKR